MPFLFVDYDQGAGGEYLSYVLSRAPQCCPGEHISTSTGRHKFQDLFKQEFLRMSPNPEIVQSHETLYDIVPCHRNTPTAKNLLGNIRSLRITFPTTDFQKYFRQQQINKVLLAREPNYAMFAGYVRMLQETATNPNFLKEISHQMDNLSLLLISKQIEPTEENRQRILSAITTYSIDDTTEPAYDYDLVIPYEKLHTDPNWVKDAVFNTFGIVADIELLQLYKTNFDHAENSSS
jgi:hypothetical protein